MYDQLLWRVRESLWNICRLVNKSVNYWTCQNVPRPKKQFLFGGVKYNSPNSTFKIDFKKGLDSEDADRRESINRLIFSSFCRADEELYKKTIFSLPNGKTHKSVISKHEHVHAKLYLKISKFCMYAATFEKSIPCGCMSMARLVDLRSLRL